MDTKHAETERVVAQGIQRQKDSEAAGFGAFLVVFLLVAAVGTWACFQTGHAGGWYVIVVAFGSVVIAGMASTRLARSALNR